MTSWTSRSSRFVISIYEAKGDYRQAYQNMKADDLMQDSLTHKRTHMRSVEIMQRFLRTPCCCIIALR